MFKSPESLCLGHSPVSPDSSLGRTPASLDWSPGHSQEVLGSNTELWMRTVPRGSPPKRWSQLVCVHFFYLIIKEASGRRKGSSTTISFDAFLLVCCGMIKTRFYWTFVGVSALRVHLSSCRNRASLHGFYAAEIVSGFYT